MRLGEMALEEAAQKAAGNWQRFQSFVWFRRNEIKDADQWAVIYTHNRDAACWTNQTQRQLKRRCSRSAMAMTPTWFSNRIRHWAVGHVDGFQYSGVSKRRNHEGIRELPRACPAYCRLSDTRRIGLFGDGNSKPLWKTSKMPHGESKTTSNCPKTGNPKFTVGFRKISAVKSKTETIKAATLQNQPFLKLSTP